MHGPAKQHRKTRRKKKKEIKRKNKWKEKIENQTKQHWENCENHTARGRRVELRVITLTRLSFASENLLSAHKSHTCELQPWMTPRRLYLRVLWSN